MELINDHETRSNSVESPIMGKVGSKNTKAFKLSIESILKDSSIEYQNLIKAHESDETDERID